MKNTIKFKAMRSIAAMLRIAGIIAFAAIIGFSFTACGEEKVKELSGKVTSWDTGTGGYGIDFSIIGTGDANSSFEVTFTTNIPNNESFKLSVRDGQSKHITQAGTGGEFTWKAVGNEFIKLHHNHDPANGRVNIEHDWSY